jgi:hypothetical protein
MRRRSGARSITNTEEGREEMNTKIKKGVLLGILTANRKYHIDQYTKAVSKYRELAVQQLDEQCARLRTGKGPLRIHFTLPVPERHTSDFDRVITMVELDTREEIDLSESDAMKYIMNHWEWERSFASNTTAYNLSEPVEDEE